MGFADISGARAVERAIAECDELGEERFLDEHGFGPARKLRLQRGPRDYPAQAVLVSRTATSSRRADRFAQPSSQAATRP